MLKKLQQFVLKSKKICLVLLSINPSIIKQKEKKYGIDREFKVTERFYNFRRYGIMFITISFFFFLLEYVAIYYFFPKLKLINIYKIYKIFYIFTNQFRFVIISIILGFLIILQLYYVSAVLSKIKPLLLILLDCEDEEEYIILSFILFLYSIPIIKHIIIFMCLLFIYNKLLLIFII